MQNIIPHENSLRNLKEKFNIKGEVLFDEPLSKHTTFKVGGPASLFCVPINKEEVVSVLNVCLQENVPFFILGGGANVVVSDKGFDGVVISTSELCQVSISLKSNENQINCEKPVIVNVEAGSLVNSFIRFLAKESLSNYGVFYGLPGTVGGAIYMNARCYNHDFSESLVSVDYYDMQQQKVITVPYVQTEWDYKKSPFQQKTGVILSGKFAVNKINCAIIKDEMSKAMDDRIKKGHFKFPSAGSVFKNNHSFGKPTGQLIDELGLKGLSVGGARVAQWHGNIIINEGSATALDIAELVSLVKKRVLERYKFELDCEIIFIGDFT